MRDGMARVLGATMGRRLSSKFLLGTMLYAGVVFVMSTLCRDYAVKVAVPVSSLLVLVLVAYLAGRMASFAAVIVASFIFAVWLFEPYGSLAIHSAVDRMELLCFGLAAVVVVHFAPGQEAMARVAPRRYSGRTRLSSFSEDRDSINPSDSLETWIAAVGYAVAYLALITLLLYIW